MVKLLKLTDWCESPWTLPGQTLVCAAGAISFPQTLKKSRCVDDILGMRSSLWWHSIHNLQVVKGVRRQTVFGCFRAKLLRKWAYGSGKYGNSPNFSLTKPWAEDILNWVFVRIICLTSRFYSSLFPDNLENTILYPYCPYFQEKLTFSLTTVNKRVYCW
jgi:hypothetical protein